jgi:predicted Zn-ribbon and HTH transcriptional regulator
MSLAKIYEGWKNHLIPAEDQKELIKEVSQTRMDICNACDLQSSNRKNYLTVRPDVHCTDCGCTLITKTKSLASSCPKLKWTAITTI